ncbi:hypothetical protein CIPAW_14G124800 [Carya illinoinensis]|uniref:Uncharacterized protein n=1 Tax=Carya illinoinensis TaxID=32201 RepID=A0A8T1NEF0_CARIL|nr:hypothetical protein CIPAW_14G124800 [Carya illinoinensis]
MNCIILFANKSETGLPTAPCKLQLLKDALGGNERSKFYSKSMQNGIGKGEESQIYFCGFLFWINGTRDVHL